MALARLCFCARGRPYVDCVRVKRSCCHFIKTHSEKDVQETPGYHNNKPGERTEVSCFYVWTIRLTEKRTQLDLVNTTIHHHRHHDLLLSTPLLDIKSLTFTLIR